MAMSDTDERFLMIIHARKRVALTKERLRIAEIEEEKGSEALKWLEIELRGAKNLLRIATYGQKSTKNQQ